MATKDRISPILHRFGGTAAAISALLLAACASSPESPAVSGADSAAAAQPAVAQPAANADGAVSLSQEQLRAQRAEESAARAREAEEAVRRQAELARQQAEAERRAEEERQRLAERQRLEQERLEHERLAALAAEREAKLARIEELETRIAELRAQVAAGDARNETMREAVLVSEQLLALLTEEQARYEEDNVDAAGNLIDPPATDAIAELEARRDGLLEQIDAC